MMFDRNIDHVACPIISRDIDGFFLNTNLITAAIDFSLHFLL